MCGKERPPEAMARPTPRLVALWDGFGVQETAALLRDPVFRGRGIPRGDGRPVLVVPGFLSGDWSFIPMHGWLKRLGYNPHFSGINFNVLTSEHLVAGLRPRLETLVKDTKAKVTLIGHSRGGLLSKVLAQRHPEQVEQVIMLGSPVSDQRDLAVLTGAAVKVAIAANQLGTGRRQIESGRFIYDLKATPAVPTVSIYTVTDAVVNFRSCLRPDIPAIQVWGSHNGLVVNPEVYRAVGRLLARPKRPA